MRCGRFTAVAAATVLVALWASSPAWSLTSGEPDFPYIDMNNNGKYDPGIDSGDATTLLSTGLFRTENIQHDQGTTPGVVIPAGVNFQPDTIDIGAEGNIIVRGNIFSTGGVALRSELGSITFGQGSQVSASGMIDVEAERDIVVGARARLVVPDEEGIAQITLRSWAGNVDIGPRASILAANQLYIGAEANGLGSVKIGRLATTASYLAQFVAGAGISARGAKVVSGLMQATAEDGDLDLSSATLKSLGDTTAHVMLSAVGHTIDMQGMRCVNIPDRNLSMDAAAVLH
jgi:hypothetical protein